MSQDPNHLAAVEPTIAQLLERSSFGSPGAKKLQARTPPDALRRFQDRDRGSHADSPGLTSAEDRLQREHAAASEEALEFISLIEAARDGSALAKASLVQKSMGLMRKTIADYTLSSADRGVVYQATLTKLFERLDSIREPESLPGWLAKTARNEALALMQAPKSGGGRRRSRQAQRQ